MTTLVIFQFNSTVTAQDAAAFRRRLHGLQTFRMCAKDAQQRCMELPLNALVADYADPLLAQAAFETEARRDALLSALEAVIYIPNSGNAVFQSLRVCSDGRCLDAPLHEAARDEQAEG